MLDDLIDPAARLLVALLAGMVLGLNRDLHGKPTGVRTLGLVALSSSLITVATMRYLARYGALDLHPDAVSRAIQGLVQGVLTGIGFIGAGVILRAGPPPNRIHGLTTAAAVWSTTIIGLVCGFGDWGLLVISVVLMLLLLVFGGTVERRLRSLLGTTRLDLDDSGR